MSKKAEEFINRQTARRVLSLIIKDVEKLGKDSGMEDAAADIAERIENVRKGLIGA